MSRSFTEAMRLLRFGVVGISALAVYWLVTNVVAVAGGAPLMAASIIGYFAAGLTSYFGHSRFSFRVAADHRVHGPRFLIVALLGLLINVAVIQACSTARVSAPVATGIVGISMPILNYVLNRLWVFGSELRGVHPSKDAM